MINTAGNEMLRINPNCDCGLTGGCKKCNPYLKESFIGCISDEEAKKMKKKLNNWKIRFNNDFERRHLELFNQS